MMKNTTLALSFASVLLCATAMEASASGFQNSCSNIRFEYAGNDAALSATCLRADGSPNATSVKIRGISNQNGKLTGGAGSSTFQQSCGNIQIVVDGIDVSISALCRKTDGSSNPTAVDLIGIENIDGKLGY